MANQQTMDQFEKLGEAMYCVFDLIELLEDEKKAKAQTASFKSKKVKALKLLESKWRLQFPAPSKEATSGASLVVGILVHILSSCFAMDSPDASLCEVALEATAVVLERCESFTQFLPSHSVLRVIAIASMCFPSPTVNSQGQVVGKADEWVRSEEAVFAAVRIISALILPPCLKHRKNNEESFELEQEHINWLCVPGSKDHVTYQTQYLEGIGDLLESSEEGSGVLAQLIQSMLAVVKGGEGGAGWPQGRLPKETSLVAIGILDALFEMLHLNHVLWRSFIPGITSQLYKVISKGSIAPTRSNMPSISNAVVSATSAGRIGAGGNATVSDFTRKANASPSVLIGRSLVLLAKVISIACRDEITVSFLPSLDVATSVGIDPISIMLSKAQQANIPPKVSSEKELGESTQTLDQRWRLSFLSRMEIVLEDSFTVARRHNSWKVRTHAVACCELLLRTCRKFLGVKMVAILVETLAVLSQLEECRSGDVRISAGNALAKLKETCSAWEWREMVLLIQQKLDQLIKVLKSHGRLSGSRSSSLTEALQLSTGLLHILSSASSSKGPPLPLESLADALSLLFMPDKGAAVLSHMNGVSFFRRSLVHLDEQAATLAAKLLGEVGKEADRCQKISVIIGHIVEVIGEQSNLAMGVNSEDDDGEEGGEEEEGGGERRVERGRVWWAQVVMGCNASFSTMVTFNHLLSGFSSNSMRNTSIIRMCHQLVASLLEDPLWLNEDFPEVEENSNLSNDMVTETTTIVSRSENSIASRLRVSPKSTTSSPNQNAPPPSHSLKSVWAESRSWVLASRLECLGILATKMGSSFQDEGLLMTCLYAVLCKATDAHPAVRQAAISTISMFARHCEEEDKSCNISESKERSGWSDEEATNQLLSDNLDYIVDAFCEDLRALSTTSNIVAHKSENTTPLLVLEFLMKSSTTSTATPLLRDVLAAVLKEVDRTCSLCPPPSNSTVMALVSCLSALVSAVEDDLTPGSFDEMDREYVKQPENHNTQDMSNKQNNSAMLSLLVELGEDVTTDGDTDTGKTEVPHIPQTLDEIKKLMIDENENEEFTVNEEAEKLEEETESQVSADTQLLLDLLPRLGYLLRFPSMQVQVASIECLEKVVRKLKRKKKLLLPAVHNAWPAFIAAMKPKYTAQLTKNLKVKSAMKREDKSKENNSIHEMPLNSVDVPLAIAACKLMTTLAEVTGDFLSFKFTEDIWPSVSLLLRSLGSNIKTRVSPMGSSSSSSSSSSNSQEQAYERMDDRRLRVALLDCCSAIASNKASSKFVVPVALQLTHLAIPFLGPPLQEGSRQAFSLCSRLVLIAPDAVWFALWSHLSFFDDGSVATEYAEQLAHQRVDWFSSSQHNEVVPSLELVVHVKPSTKQTESSSSQTQKTKSKDTSIQTDSQKEVVLSLLRSMEN